jgi:hypothetical protein
MLRYLFLICEQGVVQQAHRIGNSGAEQLLLNFGAHENN